MQLAKLNEALKIAKAVEAEFFHIENFVDFSVVTCTNSLETISVKVNESVPTMLLPTEAKDFLSKLDMAEIEVTGTAIIIRHSKGEVDFPKLDLSTYSNFIGDVPDQSFKTQAKDITEALESTSFGVDPTKVTYSGVWFTENGTYTTDGKWIIKHDYTTPVAFCLPPHADKVFRFLKGDVRVEVGRVLRFISEEIDYTTARFAHDHSPPDFAPHMVLPQSIVVDATTSPLADAIKRIVAVQSNSVTMKLIFEFGDSLTIKGTRGKEVLELKTLPHAMAADGKRLINLINRISEPTFEWSISTNGIPKMILSCGKVKMLLVGMIL